MAANSSCKLTEGEGLKQDVQTGGGTSCSPPEDVFRPLLYKYALKVKDHVYEEIRNDVCELNVLISELKTFRATLIADKGATEVINNHFQVRSEAAYAYRVIQREEQVTRRKIQQTLNSITEVHGRIAQLQKSWDQFRKEFKDFVARIIGDELAKVRCQTGPLNWKFFMPEVSISKVNSDGKQQVDHYRVKYFD